MRLSYKPLTCISVKSVTLIIEQKELSEYTMEYKDGLWGVDIQLPSGEYLYRFLLNGELLINDIIANFYFPNKEGALWSVLRINHENRRLYNNTQYNVEIKYLKKQGIDAHELKADIVGNKNISKYDLYVETDTGEIFIYKKGAEGQGIATGEYIK